MRPLALIVASIALVALPPAAARDLVEYYHAQLDHYFVTGDPGEIQALDGGAFNGWARTGQTIAVFDAGDGRLAGSMPVCRFYGNPAAGLNSHFYSASPQECEAVKTGFGGAWLLESDDVFRMHPVAPSGACPTNTRPVHRLYNRRADVNHRYTTSTTIVEAMLARGWVLEGSGGPVPVVFCAADFSAPPPPPPPPPAPTCTVNASSGAPTTGSTLTLTASCSNGPTAYVWTNCTSTTATCTTTETTAGTRTYYVNGRNAAGVGPAASVTVNWQAAAAAPPVCTLSASPASPVAGGTTTLTASCTQSPTSYQWTGCTSNGPTCVATQATTGPATYTVTATNAFGTSPPASLTVTWGSTPPPGPDFCPSYPKVKVIDLTWGGLTNTNDPGGGFEADAVLVGRLRVPPSATGTTIPGLISIVEFVDGPAERVMSLSPAACDFRGLQPGALPPTDPTGATSPMAWSIGINPNTMFALPGMPGTNPRLTPGQTYYVNVRNYVFTAGTVSCPTQECNVRITVNAPR